MIHKRSTALERSLNIFLEGFNRFHGANLTLNLDVDQDPNLSMHHLLEHINQYIKRR